MTLARAGASRWAALGVTAALHLLLAAGFLLQRADSLPEPQAAWIQLFEATPVGERETSPLPVAQSRKPSAPVRATVQSQAVAPPSSSDAHPPVASDSPFPALTPEIAPSVFERARAEAGKADIALRKEFPEHPNRLRARPRTAHQKLASRIENALAPPKLYEAPRITAVQDQGVGWGRRIDKVVTGNGTYCITYESNHGGDGRDVFKDALEPKIRTCPREE